MRYRHSGLEGGAFFFTVDLRDRTSRMLVERVGLLRDCVRRVKASGFVALIPGDDVARCRDSPCPSRPERRWAMP